MDVKLLARWDGWCDPCENGERPLLLTAAGEYGPRAWLSGVGMEDRTLVLTCGVCGEWQLCPWDEQFDDEVLAAVEAAPVVEAEVASVRIVEAPPVVEPVVEPVAEVAAAPEPEPAPAPVRHIVVRAAAPFAGPVRPTALPSLPAPRTHQETALELIAEGLDLVRVAS